MTGFCFTARNGGCPSCIIDTINYYIQDYATANGDYKYQLMMKSLLPTTKYYFHSQKELFVWAKANGLTSINVTGFSGYVFIDKNGYRYAEINGKDDSCGIAIQKLHKSYYLGGEHDSYTDCLAYAKAYLSNIYNASLF